MNNMHVKKGDTVKIIAGKDKGKTGVISKVIFTEDKWSVVIDGLNLMSKHVKPRSAQERGGIVKKSAPLNASNVQLVCASCGKSVRAGHAMVEEDGKIKKIRVCKKCNASLEIKPAVKKAAKKTAKKTAVKKSAADNE